MHARTPFRAPNGMLILLALFSPATAFAQDTTTPYNGTVDINSGGAYTNSSTVSLALSAEDDTAVTEMCISNSSSCTSWKTYATTYSWYIGTSPQGTRTVYVKYRDAAGNTSSNVTDTIVYDTVAPTGGALTTSSGTNSGEIDLSWGSFTEATSGIASYTVAYNIGSYPASKCTTGTVGYSGSSTSTTLTGLTDGTTYYIRVCAVDNAGNTSTGAYTTAIPKSEANAPTGTVVINSGATYTTSTSVTLTLSATDDTGVTQMCISNTSTCSTYQTYTTTKTWTMSGNGTKTVYVYFKDASGNISSVATDSIIVDTVKPTNPTVTALAGDMAVSLSWTASTDATSGLSYYKVVRGTSSPSSCSAGTLVYSGTSTTFTDTGLTNGTKYYYRVCGVDNAGNVGTGSTAYATAASEYDPPTNGSVTINGGNAWTNTSAVTLTLYAEDASGVSKMCISNGTTCTSYQTFATTKSWSLSGSGTTRTVRAWFQDTNGNKTSTPVSDTINIDTVKPTNGTVSATAATVSVALTWSGYADALSGVASYKVVYTKASTAPSNCSIGNVGYTGTSTSATVTGLVDGAFYSFRVCAIDAAGNMSTGATATVKTIADTVPPTGTVTINGGAAYTNDGDVTLTMNMTDDMSGMYRVCIGTDPDPDNCTHWESYASTTSWSFTETEGTHIIYAWGQDGAENIMDSPASDTIIIDVTPPVDGTVDASFSDSDTADVSWSGYTDMLSGIASYIVAYNLDGSEPADCSVADVVTSTTSTSMSVDGLTSVLPYSFRVCAIDAAGNTSIGEVGTTTPCTPTTWYMDGDGDTYGGSTTTMSCEQPAGYVAMSGDCNDSVATINPMATEVCDDVDNNCDGSIDVGAVDALTWYIDADSDTYGGTSTTLNCDQPSGYVSTSTDCDDTRSNVHPGADEFCDDLDNDCDGSIDEAALDAEMLAVDADGDGFGAMGSSTLQCDGVENEWDCNDADTTEPQVADADAATGGSGTMSAPWTSIQDAITYADECVVAMAGTYNEDIDFMGKGISVMGVEGSSVTTIDGTGTGPTVTFTSGEEADSELSGFTISGGGGEVFYATEDFYCSGLWWTPDTGFDTGPNDTGFGPVCTNVYVMYAGGGIYIDGAAPTLTDLDVEANWLMPPADYEVATDGGGSMYYLHYSFGGGIYVANSTAQTMLTMVDVRDNYADDGGGIFADSGANIALSQSYVMDNSAVWGGGIEIYAGTVALTNVAVVGNMADWLGGGVYSYAGNLLETHVTHAYDYAWLWGGSVYSVYSSTTFDSVIVYGAYYDGITDDENGMTVRYTNAYGNSSVNYTNTDPTGSNGNISGNPMFMMASDDDDYTNDNFMLGSGSASTDMGNPIWTDADGTRSDQGAFGGPNGMWDDGIPGND